MSENIFLIHGAAGGTWALWGIGIHGGAGLQVLSVLVLCLPLAPRSRLGLLASPAAAAMAWGSSSWQIPEALQLISAPTVREASRQAVGTLRQARGEELRSPAKANQPASRRGPQPGLQMRPPGIAPEETANRKRERP